MEQFWNVIFSLPTTLTTWMIQHMDTIPTLDTPMDKTGIPMIVACILFMLMSPSLNSFIKFKQKFIRIAKAILPLTRFSRPFIKWIFACTFFTVAFCAFIPLFILAHNSVIAITLMSMVALKYVYGSIHRHKFSKSL